MDLYTTVYKFIYNSVCVCIVYILTSVQIYAITVFTVLMLNGLYCPLKVISYIFIIFKFCLTYYTASEKTYTCVKTHVYKHTYTLAHIYMYIYIHTHTDTCFYTCIYM